MNKTTSIAEPAIIIPNAEDASVIAEMVRNGHLPVDTDIVVLRGNAVDRPSFRPQYQSGPRVSPATMEMIRRKVRLLVRTGASYEWPGVVITHLMGTTIWTPTPKFFGVRRTMRIS